MPSVKQPRKGRKGRRRFDHLVVRPYNWIDSGEPAASDERPPQWRPVNLVRVEIQQP